jgi:hypothetical protein
MKKIAELGNWETFNITHIKVRVYCFSFRVKHLFPVSKIPKSSPHLYHFVPLSLIDHKALWQLIILFTIMTLLLANNEVCIIVFPLSSINWCEGSWCNNM